mmetsp:Transcript_1847/g.5397  ORF Transcript_1847/g.5397 Transcript_1847/m.5397 type:complete len:201 (-) Transcript_1847:130-732(-)
MRQVPALSLSAQILRRIGCATSIILTRTLARQWETNPFGMSIVRIGMLLIISNVAVELHIGQSPTLTQSQMAQMNKGRRWAQDDERGALPSVALVVSANPRRQDPSIPPQHRDVVHRDVANSPRRRGVGNAHGVLVRVQRNFRYLHVGIEIVGMERFDIEQPVAGLGGGGRLVVRGDLGGQMSNVASRSGGGDKVVRFRA